MPAAYLKIPDIKGASADAQFKDWIPIQSYQFETSRTRATVTNHGGAGSPAISEIIVTKLNDISTPLLQQAAVKGTIFPVVVLRTVHPSADGGGGITQTLELTDAVISSWHMSGAGGQGQYEMFTLNFRGISHKVEADPEPKQQSPVVFRSQLRGGGPARSYRKR